MSRTGLVLLYCVSALYLSTASAGTIYRWVDSKGDIHYSQVAPRSGRYQQINPQLPPPTSAPAVQELGTLARRYQSERAQAQKQHEAELRSKAEKAEACAKARRRISALEGATAHRLFVPTANGGRARMNEQQYQKLLNQARSVAQENCSG